MRTTLFALALLLSLFPLALSALQSGTNQEVTLAESFRQSLDQAFSETNGIAFLATNFVSRRFGVDPIPLTAATNIWASWRSWTSYPIPRTSLVRREVGPVQNAEFLWAFIPMNTGTSVFWLPIIFADSRWRSRCGTMSCKDILGSDKWMRKTFPFRRTLW